MAQKKMTQNNTELSELDLAGLVDELRATKQEALNLRFRNATGQLENVAAIRAARRQIARINTLIRQQEIAAAEAGQVAATQVKTAR
jgi:large subunit ribosomal protein L29